MQFVVKELTGTSPRNSGKYFLAPRKRRTSSILTNLQKRSRKHAQQQSAVTEQRFSATPAIARYVENAQQQLAKLR